VDKSQLIAIAEKFAETTNCPPGRQNDEWRKVFREQLTQLVNGLGGPFEFVRKVPFGLYDASHSGQGAVEARVRILWECVDPSHTSPPTSYFFFVGNKIKEAIEGLPDQKGPG
jgi:hypothetical protein